MKFDGVKVFSTTKVKDRQMLGETITEWLRLHSNYEVVGKEVTQSSDKEFHCFTITLFYRVTDKDRASPPEPAT